MDDFDKIIATAKVIARPENAVENIVILRKQLDIAVNALSYYQSSDGSIKSLSFSTKIANDALAEIERLSANGEEDGKV
jgi:hypothetical protein